jgi:aminopeptidase N
MVGISQIFPQNYLNQHVINSEKSNFRKFKNFKANALTNNYDIIYHRANWEAYPDQYIYKRSNYFLFQSKMDGMAQVVFDLSSQLQVDSVTQQGVKSTFTFQNQMLTIQLSKTLAFNDIDSVTIFYQGAPVDDGFGSFATSQHGEGTPVLWTLSEPYGARDWWPCKQSLTDKIDSMDIFVKSNKEFKVGSNGKLIKETVAGDLKTTHWQTKSPIATYLVAIAITDYSVYSDTALVGDSHAVEILNYAYPESLNQAIATSDYTVHNIEFFSNLFIPYPFYKEKYGHAQFGWGGGMEHQTMTFLCCFNEGLITHELAHQWFGDYVTCGSWKDIWINEGFATFCEGLTMEHFNPGSEIGWRANERDYITTEPGGSVIVDDTTSVNRIFSGRLSYTKGGMFIVMLRNEIGDEAFFNGCKLLLTESAKKGGFATTKQVEEYFETAADTNLTEFFNNWLYGEGYRFMILFGTN